MNLDVLLDEALIDIDRRLREHVGVTGVRFKRLPPEFDRSIDVSIGQEHQWRPLMLSVFPNGGLGLFAENAGICLAYGFLDDGEEGSYLDEIVDVLVRVARFGLVVVGFPFRRVTFAVTPIVPDDAAELHKLLRKGVLTYNPPWSSQTEIQ